MNIPPSTVRMRLRVKEAAGYTGLSASTLNKFRLNGHGPRFIKAGPRCVVYAIKDLDEWMAERTHNSTAEYIPQHVRQHAD
jgi:predicted DNA-binding transcriptional regulator AlpA